MAPADIRKEGAAYDLPLAIGILAASEVIQSDKLERYLLMGCLLYTSDPEQREQEIKNISSVYKTLADEILPQLRRSRLTLNLSLIHISAY